MRDQFIKAQDWLVRVGRVLRASSRRYWTLLVSMGLILAGTAWLAPSTWRRHVLHTGGVMLDHWEPLVVIAIGLVAIGMRGSRWWRRSWRQPGSPRRSGYFPVADRVPLFVHVALLLLVAVVVAVVVGALLWIAMGHPTLTTHSPSRAAESSGPVVAPATGNTAWTVQNTFDAIKIVLAVVAGIGGVVALTVAYRKQDHGEAAERRESIKLFNERFGRAADQLGSDRTAIRLAGAYAMAALADDWDEGRQICIDVLCAYLRMPYIPSGELSSPSAISSPSQEAETGEQRVDSPATAPESDAVAEQQVRHAVLRLIRNHLRPAVGENRPHWHGRQFDLSGAVLDGGDLSFIRILADTVLDFTGARFLGNVSFVHATFSGGEVLFNKTTFSGDRLGFVQATFSDGRVSFDDSSFSSGTASFLGASFAGGKVSFRRATFACDEVQFNGATFSGPGVSFDTATFSRGRVSFFRATFAADKVSFNCATFAGAMVDFYEARFANGKVYFGLVKFADGLLSFSKAIFVGSEVSFGDDFSVEGSPFTSRATFSGGVVDLSCPRVWAVPPVGVAGSEPGVRWPSTEHLAKLETRPTDSDQRPASLAELITVQIPPEVTPPLP
jgi:hypothetical protein